MADERQRVGRDTVAQVAARAGLDLTTDDVDAVTADLDRLVRWAETLPTAVAPPPDDLQPRRRADQPVPEDAQAILNQAPDHEGKLLRLPPVLPDST
ncbi:MAG: hypothetical protein GXP62_04535 [Oligoflexia bacterium]|nr:hypothetical protein [Oligoflexia bacterium]